MSRRAITLLALLVLLLAAVVLVDRPGARVATRDQRVLPGLDAERIEIQRPGAPPTVIVRAGEGFVVDGRPADDAAVRDLTGSLETLAWRRRVPAAAEHGLDAPRFTVRVTGANGSSELKVGRAEPALGWTWIGDGGSSDYLVDDYAARALDRAAPELRQRAPFRFVAADLERLSIQGLVLHGRPLCVEAPGGGCAVADVRRVASLLERLEELTLTRFLDADPPGPTAQVIRAGDQILAIHGACPGVAAGRAVSSSVGPGCVSGEAAAALLAEPLDPLLWVEPRVTSLEPGAVDHIVAGSLRLDRHGGSWRAGSEELAPEAVRDFLGALASHQGTPSWSEPITSGSPAITLSAGNVEQTLILRGQVVQRRGEPVALAVHPSIRAVFTIDPVTLADRRVLELDPYTIAEIRVEEPGAPPEIAVRGATLESWSLSAPLAIAADGAAVTALRDAASTLTAAAVLGASAAPEPWRRRLTLGIDGGGSEVLELGAALDDGCLARRAGRPFIYRLRARACAALSAHLATRKVLEVEVDDVLAITVANLRVERHGAIWYRAHGERLSDREAEPIGILLRALISADEVVGYGAAPRGAEVIVETPAGAVSLVIGRELYSRHDRPVLYRTPPAALSALADLPTSPARRLRTPAGRPSSRSRQGT